MSDDHNIDDAMPGMDDLLGLDEPGSQLERNSDADPFAHAVVDANTDLAALIQDELRQGDFVADAKLTELLAAGGGLVCWKAKRGDDGEVTVHALTKGASAESRDAFLAAVSDFASALGDTPIEGVLPVKSVDPLAGAYIGEVAPLGTMADVPLLNWDVKQKLDFLRRLTSTLKALHARDLAHGCLRPETVVLDEELHPVLANAGAFDIAQHCKQDPVASQKHRDYAAPSVLDGERADPFADMYSLGRLMQFMLEGAAPSGFGEKVPRLDALAKLPPGLVRIVRRCTVLNPAQRYPNMDELLADLDRYERDETVGMPHPEVDDIARYTETGKLTRKGGKGKAADKRADKAPRARTRREPSALSARANAVVRALLFIFGGLALIAGGVYGAYRSGVDEPLWMGVAMVGGVLLGFVPPTFGQRKALSRLFLVVLCLSVIFLTDITRRAAKIGAERSGLKSDTLEARLETFRSMKRDGEKDFSGANLMGADLTGVDLQGCNLASANLENAVLRGANLKGASLINTRVAGANVSGADLGEVNPDFVVGWSQVECDSTSTMPTGWSCTNSKPVKANAAGNEDELKK